MWKIKNISFDDLDIICWLSKATLEKVDWLTYEESMSWQERIHRRGKMDWLSSRIAAKVATIQWLEKNYQLELRPELINIFNISSGAPCIKWSLEIPVPNLSISHKNRIGLASVSNMDIFHGCDIEFIKDRHSEFVNYFLSCHEKELWFNNEIKVNNKIISRIKTVETMLWSAKESVIKAIFSTEGLKEDINMSNIFLEPNTNITNHNKAPHFLFSCNGYKGIGKWRFINDYVITISVLESNY